MGYNDELPYFIRETLLEFRERMITREIRKVKTLSKIVVHHAASAELVSVDLSAEDFHRIHRSQDWVGLGYHFVVRWDNDEFGKIERGRPLEFKGSHAAEDQKYDPKGIYNYNDSGTIAICFAGNLHIAPPKPYQIQAGASLIAYLCKKYNLNPTIVDPTPITDNKTFETNKTTIVGHCDLMLTACPGRHLYDLLPYLRERAYQYMYHEELKDWEKNYQMPDESMVTYQIGAN